MSIPKKLLDELRTKLDDDAWQTYLNELEGFINTKKTRNHTTGSNATPVRPSQRAGSEADNREMSHGEKVKQEGEAPPGWRWETFASGGCILLWLTLAITMPLQELIYYLLGMAGLVYFAYSICAFGLVFGISGARQGHLTNRIIAGTVALLNGVLLYSTTHVIPPPLIISGP